MYQFKAGRSVAGKKAEDVGDELARINDKHGELTPSQIVKESRPAKALLHDVFEWDDQTAAEEYRIHQARLVINCVTVVDENLPDTRPVQAFVSITVMNEDEENERRYIPAQQVTSNPKLLEQHLDHLKRRLKNIRIDHAAFTELAAVWQAIDTAVR